MEFTLVFGFMLTVFFAMLEFGLALDEQLALAAAARSGARLAAVEGGATDHVFDTIAHDLRGFGVEPGDVAVRITPHQAIYGTPVTVELSARYTLRTPVARALGIEELSLRAQATSRSEKLATPGS
ncbi:MAG: pilus assembly protein [Clostridia bacterium]|nr:pilus assembly protein [Clostridia bacterium]